MRRLLKQYYVREFLSREKKWDETGNSTGLIRNVLPQPMGAACCEEKSSGNARLTNVRITNVRIFPVVIFPVVIFPVVIFMREI